MRPLAPLLRCLALVLLITLTAAQARAQSYVIEGLGGVVPKQINSIGQVTGFLEIPGGHSRAFLWTDGVLKVLDPLPGDTDSEANSLNDSGKVVGISYRGPRSATTPFNGVLWAPTYTRQLNAAGGASVEPRDINNASVIAGCVRRGDPWQAILWTAEGVREISGVEQTVGVNEHGDVAGRTWGFRVGWLWRDGAALELGREFAELNQFATSVAALNTRGQLALNRLDAKTNLPTAFRWTDGVYLPLGHLGLLDQPSAQALAEAINDAGDVVGFSRTTGGAIHAFLYQDSTGIVDLNTRIPPGSGWELYSASAINNRGQIVGMGSKGGFRLTPVWPLPGFLRPR